MSNLTLEKAQAILGKYNKEAFHLRHAAIVSGVMGWYAARLDPDREEFWRVVGLLHDVDFELYPEEHCVKGIELLKGEGVPEDVIRSALSHGWGMTGTPYQPQLEMEKVLFATDELTGLIGAAALMRPSRSVSDIEVQSVKKKFKDKKFAAGCSRDVIRQGAEMLGVDLDRLIGDTIEAMRSLAGEMEI